jgi:nitrous oxidase accessory protein NosD
LIGPGINTRSHLMDLITVSGFSLEGCSVENFGIAGVILTDSMYARIKDNNFKNIYEYGMGYPILLHNASEKILIINNTFSGKANHHIAQGARTGNPGNGGIVRSVEIINNKFEGSDLAAIDAHVPYCGPLIVRENYFLNCFNGISAYNAFLEASGNTFENCAVGINVPPGTETRSTLIINNTIIGGVYGVKVKSPNVDIMYNQFIDCGIYVVGVARTINITGNSFTPTEGDTIIFEGTPLD